MQNNILQLWKEIYTCRKCTLAKSIPLPFYITDKYKGILFCGRNPGLAHHGEYSNKTHKKEFEYNEWVKRYESGLKNSNVGRFYIEVANKSNLEFENFCITNIAKCSFENNRELSKEEIDNCIPWLQKICDLLQPKKVVTFGSVANKMFKRIGVRFCEVIESVHPTYLLTYRPKEKEKWINSISEFLKKEKSYQFRISEWQ